MKKTLVIILVLAAGVFGLTACKENNVRITYYLMNYTGNDNKCKCETEKNAFSRQQDLQGNVSVNVTYGTNAAQQIESKTTPWSASQVVDKGKYWAVTLKAKAAKFDAKLVCAIFENGLQISLNFGTGSVTCATDL